AERAVGAGRGRAVEQGDQLIGRGAADAEQAVGDVARMRDRVVAVAVQAALEVRALRGAAPADAAQELVAGVSADAVLPATALCHRRARLRSGLRDGERGRGLGPTDGRRRQAPGELLVLAARE